MDFVAVVDQVIALLRQRGRVTYRTLQLQFQLDDERARRPERRTPLWPTAGAPTMRGGAWSGPATWHRSRSPPAPAAPPAQAPLAYTPPYLAEKILTSRSALEGERKQVTVLFADLKGSMELLADRDPEEARQLLDPVLERMMAAVHRYEGTVNQVMGDGIMALFGAPLAHEDHAVRACYAALAMQDAVQQLCRRGAAHPRRARADARRAQRGRGGGARHWQRPPHGLLGHWPDHPPGRPHGADGHAGQILLTPARPAAGRGVGAGHPAGPGARQRPGGAGGGL